MRKRAGSDHRRLSRAAAWACAIALLAVVRFRVADTEALFDNDLRAYELDHVAERVIDIDQRTLGLRTLPEQRRALGPLKRADVESGMLISMRRRVSHNRWGFDPRDDGNVSLYGSVLVVKLSQESHVKVRTLMHLLLESPM